MKAPHTFVCRAGPVVTRPYDDLYPTEDGSLWHDHSTEGGDIVCMGPFSLFFDRSMYVTLCSASWCGKPIYADQMKYNYYQRPFHEKCYAEIGTPLAALDTKEQR